MKAIMAKHKNSMAAMASYWELLVHHYVLYLFS